MLKSDKSYAQYHTVSCTTTMVKPKDYQTTKLSWNFLPWLGAPHRDSQVAITPPLLPKPGQVSELPALNTGRFSV